MAKAQLTKQAIKYLVETYNCEESNYTFQQIKEMIMTKFKVSVSVEALRKSYHKNKDSIFESDKPVQNPVIKQKSIIEKKVSNSESNQSSNKNSFNDNVADTLSKDSVNDLLK